jgi:predicted nucleic acid-binding protein
LIVYAESSVVLAWLLGEPAERAVRDVLRRADDVVSSTLTLIECARGLMRAVALRRISAAEQLAALRLLDQARSSWLLHELTGPVVTRAGERFPAEPVRTLDALHLATAALFHGQLGAVTVASLDDRVRDNARALGLAVAP